MQRPLPTIESLTRRVQELEAERDAGMTGERSSQPEDSMNNEPVDIDDLVSRLSLQDFRGARGGLYRALRELKDARARAEAAEARAAALRAAIEAAVNYCNEADSEASRGRIGGVILPWAGTIRHLLAAGRSKADHSAEGKHAAAPVGAVPEQHQTLQDALGLTDEQMAEQQEQLSATFDRILQSERQAATNSRGIVLGAAPETSGPVGSVLAHDAPAEDGAGL